MNLIRTLYLTIFLAILIVVPGCTSFDDSVSIEREPSIAPDNSGITIPPNIAPVNFTINEKGELFEVRIKSHNGEKLKLRSRNGVIKIPHRSWKKMLVGSRGNKMSIEVLSKSGHELTRYAPFYLHVSSEAVDPYIMYRLIHPGYELWSQLKIMQRSLEDFRESSVFENQLLNDNCVNCHSFVQNDPDKFLLHVRGAEGGTYFVNGKEVKKIRLQTEEMPNNAVYPAWHPGGAYVAFSSNKTVQSFHMRPEKNIEVYDQFSSLVFYDVINNEISPIEERDTAKYMETFPYWTPDGKYLYYCRASQTNENTDYTQVKYNLVRKSFDQETLSFGDAEIVFDARAIDKSVSFPCISPDGQYLVFTLHDYGTFSIWHKEADLHLIDLKTGKSEKMDLNSDNTESYHSWSSNSKWLVFSSKRDDGLTARPYLAFIGPNGKSSKPFILPQKDPRFYKTMEKTYNRPEFMTGKSSARPRDFEKASKEEAVKARWGGKQ